LQQLGWMVSDHDPERSARLCHQSQSLYQELGDRHGMANVLDTLGRIARDTGAYDRAHELYQDCLALRQATGDRKGIAQALLRLSSIAQYRDQNDAAVRLMRESISICQEIDDRGGVSSGLNDLSTTLVFLGRPAEARELIEDSPAIQDNLGYVTQVAHFILGYAHMQLGEYRAARRQAQLSLDFAQETGFTPHIARGYWLLGCIALAQDAFPEAEAHLLESLAALQTLGQEQAELAFVLLGYANWGLRRVDQALRYLFDALKISAAAHSAAMPLGPLLALPAIALSLVDQGEVERAVELHALVTRYPFAAHSRWFEDVAGRRIAESAAALPPDTSQAAQQRGETLDLWGTVDDLMQALAGE
jgi:tetratricopeptide (TPR) repeat protein